MAQMNAVRTRTPVRTHGGAPAFPHTNALQTLRRSVLACLLWEDNFYEDGESVADRIRHYASKVSAEELAGLAVEARTEFNLRHVPLLLLLELLKKGAGPVVSDAIVRTVRRPDEMSELLALYWKDGKRPLAAQLKKGLARAFTGFDAYQLAKYNRDREIKLRDVLFLTHAKPKDKAQEKTFKDLAEGTLASPDTWEVGLSGGADKKETFTRLLSEGKLGYMALLRNLRNMQQSGVDAKLVKQAILARKGAQNVLPFRYVSAARAAPQFEPYLDEALQAAISESKMLDGQTLVLADVSGSMSWGSVSKKSDITRMDAAATLASMINGDVRMFSFSNAVVEVPPRRGMAGVEALIKSQHHGGTDLAGAVTRMNEISADRLIVITDEQATTGRVPDPKFENAYMINVATYQNGVGYGKWTHLDGFSESVLRWIHEYESFNDS